MNSLFDANDNDVAVQRAIAVVQAEDDDVLLLVALRVVDERLFIVALVHTQRTLNIIIKISKLNTNLLILKAV